MRYLIFLILICFPFINVHAQVPVAGDSCSTEDISAQSQDGGRPVYLVCNGSTWAEIMNTSSNGNVSIGVVSPTTSLEVAGTISATNIVGDGSGLTGIVVDSVSWYDVTNMPAGVTDLSNTALETAELTQLQNIDATAIGGAQFGYLGAMDQGVATTDSVTFAELQATGDISATNILAIGDVDVSGTVTATAFVGDGSGLTNVSGGSGGLWTDNTDHISYSGFNFYNAGATYTYANATDATYIDMDRYAFRLGRASYYGDYNSANVGNYSFAMGLSARASGDNSFATGSYAEASGTNSFAILGGKATASNSVALGGTASGSTSVAMLGGQATGSSSIAIGGSSEATTSYTVAIGYGATSSAHSSVSVGFQSASSGLSAVAIGEDANAAGHYSLAAGYGSATSGDYSAALTPSAIADGNRSVAFGHNARVTGDHSVIIAAADVTGTVLSAANTIALMGASGGVGINTLTPAAALDVVGDVRGTSFTSTSDRSFKENIQHLENGLEKVLNLRGVSYTFKQDTGRNFPKTAQIGLIAQEVETVFPEVVSGEEGNKAVNYAALVAPLIEAVKAVHQRNEELEQKNAALEQRLEALEQRIALY